MMGRRGFFKAIGAGVLGMALALKVPDRRPMEVNFWGYGHDLSPELLEETMQRYIRPAAQAIAEKWDARLLSASGLAELMRG